MSDQRHIAVFGGSFDPPHLGHRLIIESLAKLAWLDEIIILPAANPPHKKRLYRTPFGYRQEMANLAFGDLATISNLELKRLGASYTYQTLELLNEHYLALGENVRLSFVIGGDSLADIFTWMRVDRIIKAADLIITSRPGIDKSKMKAAYDRLVNEFGAKIFFLDCPVADLSSTVIREEIHNFYGNSLQALTGISTLITDFTEARNRIHGLDSKVLEFILTNGFYGYPGLGQNLSPDTLELLQKIELQLAKEVNLSRYLHCLNVGIMSLGFAAKFAINPDQALIAGVLHDFAKFFDRDKCLKLCPYLKKLDNYPYNFWHADLSAYVAEYQFGIKDEALLTAIRIHSTLEADCSDLAKLLFVADKLEPSRTYTDLAPLRQYLNIDLTIAATKTLQTILKHEQAKGHRIPAASQRYLDSLNSINSDK